MLPHLDLRAPDGLFIDGSWVPAEQGGRFDSVCPATGETIATLHEATEVDVDKAARAAHDAFRGEWSRTTPDARSDALMAFAERIRDNAERLALIETVDNGSSGRRMRADVERAPRMIHMYADLARHIRGHTAETMPERLDYVIRQPYGVVAQIIPFNHPIAFAVHAIAISLATANTVILKPSEFTSLSTRELVELSRDLFPPGVVNLLTGAGEAAGRPLVEHELVQKVHFRGSMATGRAIRRACARREIGCTLELGGKNPFIVYPDADVTSAVEGAVGGLNLGHQGQSCMSATRLFVHDDVFDEFRDGLVTKMEAVRVGVPWDEDTDMGALVSRPQYDRVLSLIESGRAQGARALTGGGPVRRADLPADGLFIEPTVFAVDDPTIRIAREEIFGPVTCLFRWSDEADMLRVANDVEYGLTASVWTRDIGRAHRVARLLEAGTVWVNQHGYSRLGIVRVAWKGSGLGHERALEEIESYTRDKVVLMNLAGF